ncbi:20589_t:CDS:2 [Entrophospora sp. SA101]|nr:20589_t:CDS:2 [Entrophospora sp. SA101]
MEPLSSNNGPIRSRKNRIHSRRPYERTGTASTSVASTTNSNNIWLYINNMFGHLNNYFSNWLKRLTTTTTATTLEETTGLQRTITSPVSSKISTTFGLNQGNNKINPFWYKNFAQLRDQNPKSNSSLFISSSSHVQNSVSKNNSLQLDSSKQKVDGNVVIEKPTISLPTPLPSLTTFDKLLNNSNKVDNKQIQNQPKLSTTTMPSNEASTTASDEKSKSSNTPLLNSLPFSTTTTDYIKSKVVGSNPDSMDIDMGSATTITSHTTTVTDPAVASSITTPSVTNQKINTAITHTTKPWASSPNLSSNPSTPQTTPQTFGNNSLFDFFPQNTRNILINPKTGFVQKNPNESSMQFGSNGFDSGNSFGGVSGNGSARPVQNRPYARPVSKRRNMRK